MCGRACCVLQPQEVSAATHTTAKDFIDQDKYSPHYNVSPGMATPILYRDKTSKHLVWGLIPSYIKPEEKVNHFMRFNARSESMAETPAYRQLVDQKRCVVLFNGFYEWQKLGKSDKQPYFIHLADSPVMRIAGLYDTWRNDQGDLTYTYSIITTESPPKMTWIHTRMPLILKDAADAERWLDDGAAGTRPKPFLSLVHPYSHDDMAFHPVTKQVGQATFDSDACIAKVDIRVAGKITSFYKQGDAATEGADTAPSIKTEKLLTAPGASFALNVDPSDGVRDTASLSPARATSKRKADASPPTPLHQPEWTCHACTFANSGDATVCAMCTQSRALPPNEWPCATCTFANPSTAPACSMCHTARVSKSPRKLPTPAPKKPKLGPSPQKPITSFFSKQ